MCSNIQEFRVAFFGKHRIVKVVSYHGGVLGLDGGIVSSSGTSRRCLSACSAASAAAAALSAASVASLAAFAAASLATAALILDVPWSVGGWSFLAFFSSWSRCCLLGPLPINKHHN